jgi:hypothetical protein
MILLAACKKDKDNEEISLNGKWVGESSIIKEFENDILVFEDNRPGDGTT